MHIFSCSVIMHYILVILSVNYIELFSKYQCHVNMRIEKNKMKDQKKTRGNLKKIMGIVCK